MIYRRIKEYLDKREKKQPAAPEQKGGGLATVPKPPEPTPDGGAVQEVKVEVGSNTPPSRHSATQNILKGSSFAALAGADRKVLPGAPAGINPEVMGGGLANMGFGGRRLKPENFVGDQIVDIGATSLGVERDLGGGDMFIKRLNSIDDGVGGGSQEVVQAIDRLTFITMNLVAATKEQTATQKQIAQQQLHQAEKLALQAKASAEESALEGGGDFSGNTAYQKLLSASGGALSGGRSGGGPGFGVGGKILAKKLAGSAIKRGGERVGTRLAARIGGKAGARVAQQFGARAATKLGVKGIGKAAGGAIAKSLGKKIPLVGLGLGAAFAAQRALQGDFVGAGLELASGAASTIPGIGTAGSIGIDAALAARDMGVTPFAQGGIISDPTMGLVGEKGKEGVFPLQGTEGKKTFRMFGEGILDAQKRNRKEYAKLQAEGMLEYYEKKNGWAKWWEGFKEFLSKLPVIGHLFRDNNDPNNPGGNGGGGGVRGGVNAANIEADTAEEKAFIATVRETEGTAGAQGYNTVYGGAVVPQLTQMTLKELYDAIKLGGTDKIPDRLGGGTIPFKKDQYNSSASGALQLMPATLLSMINRGEFKWDDVFSPETQNRMILTLARNGGVDIENMSPAMIDKASGIWAGLSGAVHGQTSRTGEYTYNNIYKQNLKEAQTQAPTPDPADDRRKIDTSQQISRNFGRNVRDSIAFTHNGKDYHAVKTTNGWDLYFGKGGIHGNKGRVDTSNGKNQGVVDSFMEQAEAGGGYTVPDDGEFERSLERAKTSSATSDGSTKLAMRSAEENLVASAGGNGGSTIINNFYGSNGNSNTGNSPENILPSPGSESTATQLYHVLQTLNA
jgi:muramidase (phage lysozyme)